jgi:alpha-tubulin suppressor-like RCC1 family protein
MLIGFTSILFACTGSPLVGAQLDASEDTTIDKLIQEDIRSDGMDVLTMPDVGPDAPVGIDAIPLRDLPPDSPQCTSDEQCGAGSEAPRCDVVLRRCVRCVPGERDDCPTAQHCDRMMFVCVPGCRNDDGCAMTADAGSTPETHCLVTANRCVQCVTNDHCPLGNVCSGNVCVPGCDLMRPCAAGATCCGGGCVDITSNLGHCGACARGCAFANAEPACRMSSCAIGRCNAGYENCDGMLSNGCETSTSNDVANCGMCGRMCPVPPSATPACRMGTCGIGVCAGGFGDCDGEQSNGCEVDVRVSASHCGACGMACPLVANADPVCTMSTCGFTCRPGFGDCDGDAANGCEVDLTTSSAHCGACRSACAPLSNATVSCVASRCTVGTCSTGFANCDRLDVNGCETDTGSNALHCGRCGNICPIGQICTAGTCAVPCPPGQQRCGMTCTNTANDPANCGMCGTTCGTGLFCNAGRCTSSCSTGQVMCSGACVTTATDNTHCGTCGNRCSAGFQCTAGTCVLTCPTGQTSCGSTCANLRSDNANCGRCGVTCGTSDRCVEGVCTLVCPDPQIACSGLCTDVTRDSNNCGSCGMLCPTGCVSGRCSSIIDMESAQNNNCLLYASGRVFCWGLNGGINRSGGSFGHNSAPVQVINSIGAPLENVVQLAGGQNAMCARRSNNTVQCWGSSVAVTEVTGLTGVTHISGRGTEFCAVTGGQVVCWTASVLTPGVALAGLTDATAVAVGSTFKCALRTGGSVVCWGNNAYGNLGNATTAASATPVPVFGLTDATSVVAGEHYACALRRTGAVVCWGRNQSGQLGDGDVVNRTVPYTITSLTGVTSLRTGMRHACAVIAGGAVRCWGENTFTQLGDGTNVNRGTPVAVSTLAGQRAVSVYLHHSCALGSDGRVQCWGNNPFGEAGGGTEVQATPIAITGVADAVDVQQGSGGNHATGAGTSWRCVLRRSGVVSCWGSASQGNSSGQLGDGTTVQRAIPGNVNGLTDVTKISVNGSVACAVKRDATAVCWGLNNYGQLGDGTTTNRLVPTPVMGLTGVADIQTNGISTCARRTDGSVWCWGYNFYGELGQGDMINRPTPTAIAALGTNAQELWFGLNFGCARLTSGQVHCWGRNIEGELADGSSTNRYVPGAVTTTASTPTTPAILTGITALPFCGPYHCVAFNSATSTYWDWGYANGGVRARTSMTWSTYRSYSTNYGYGTASVRLAGGVTTTVSVNYGEFGLIGDGTLRYNGTGNVVGGDRFERVSVSNNAYGPTCAIDTTGQLFCWGWTGDSSLLAAGRDGITRMPALITTP